MKINFVCTNCEVELTENSSQYICENCGLVFAKIENIPVFSKDKNFYYGEIPEEKMDILLEETRKFGWEMAFINLLKRCPLKKKMLMDYVLDETRTAWKYLLNIKKDGVLLDYGCGWGSTSINLSRSFGSIVAMDLTYKRLQFLRERSKALNCNNLTFVCGGDTKKLPFPDKCFDTVVLNGVFEWIPVSFKESPSLAQKRFINEIKRILKPSGQMLMAIENRFGYKYFFGVPDEHTGVKYITLLPRILANVYSKLKVKKEYKPYTYSLKGYKSILREAAFGSTKFFIPFPDYRFFSEIIDLSEDIDIAYNSNCKKLSIKRFFKYLFTKSVLIRKAYKYFANSYLIIAESRKQSFNGEVSFIDKLKQEIKNDEKIIGNDEILNIVKIKNYHVSHTDTVILKLGFYKKNDLVLKLPLNPTSSFRLERQSQNLRSLKKINLSSDLKVVIPSFLKKGRLENQVYFAEQCVPGNNIFNFHIDQNDMKNVTDAAIKYITNLHKFTREVNVINEDLYNLLIKQKILEINENEFLVKNSFINKISKYLNNVLIGKQIPLVGSHGDYWLKNILVDKKENCSITGVIDWDLYEDRSFPLLDIIHFFIFEQEYMTDDLVCYGMLNKLLTFSFNKEEANYIYAYLNRFQIPRDMIFPLSVIYCIYQIYFRKKYVFEKTCNPDWQDAYGKVLREIAGNV